MSVIGDALRRAEEDGAASLPRAATDANGRQSGAEWSWSAAASPRSSRTTLAAGAILAIVAMMLIVPPYLPTGDGASSVLPPASRAVENAAPGPAAGPRAAVLDSVAAPAIAVEPALPTVPLALGGSTAVVVERPGMGPAPQPRAQPAAPALPPASPASQVRVATADSAIARRFQLEGVMLSGSSRMAVVNGAIVEVGQTVDGAIVREIDRRYITVEIDGQWVRVPLRAPAGGRAEH